MHAYWNLRPAVIWDSIQNDLPPLVAPLRRLLSRSASGTSLCATRRQAETRLMCNEST